MSKIFNLTDYAINASNGRPEIKSLILSGLNQRFQVNPLYYVYCGLELLGLEDECKFEFTGEFRIPKTREIYLNDCRFEGTNSFEFLHVGDKEPQVPYLICREKILKLKGFKVLFAEIRNPKKGDIYLPKNLETLEELYYCHSNMVYGEFQIVKVEKILEY